MSVLISIGAVVLVLIGVWLWLRFVVAPRAVDSLSKEGRKHYEDKKR